MPDFDFTPAIQEASARRVANDKALSMLLDAARWAEIYEHKHDWAKEARRVVAIARGKPAP